MSSKRYFSQLQTSGTDFNNFGTVETDFLDEKKTEMDILGMTDDSVESEDSSDTSLFKSSGSNSLFKGDNCELTDHHYRSFLDDHSDISDQSDNSDQEASSESPYRTSNPFDGHVNIYNSHMDDPIIDSLSKSQHKEELLLTDTESDSEDSDLNVSDEMDMNIDTVTSAFAQSYMTSIHKSKESKDKPIQRSIEKTEVIDLDSSTDSSEVTIVNDNFASTRVTFKDVKKERKRLENIMDSEVEAEIKALERGIARNAGILTSKWDEDWEREWGDGNALNMHRKDEVKPINRGSIFASHVYKGEVDLPQYASYMHLEPQKSKFQFNLFDLIKEFFVVMILHLYLGIFNAMFNIITIDGMVSCLIFFMASIGITKGNNFLDKIRLITIDRYIYYILLFAGVHIVNYITWFQFPEVTRYLASFMICPSIMAQIYQIKAYAKIRQFLYDGYNNLIKKIICKQLAKIINMFIENVLVIDTRVSYADLMIHYHDFDFVVINKFIVTFILALIFNHIDKGSLRLPIMIYKNFYMKDSEYNIADDKKYLTAIIKDQKWDKFLNVYTLNRMIRMLIENDDKDADLSQIIKDFLKRQFFRLNRVMFCWSMMSLTGSLLGGVVSFLLFIQHAEMRFRYFLNVLAFACLSRVTEERILVLFLCELCFPIFESKLIFDIARDTYSSVKRGVLSIYDNTRTESLFFSVLLSILSFFGFNMVAMGIVICINLIMMIRFRKSDLNIGEVRMIKVDKPSNPSAPNMDSIMEVTRDMSLSGIRNYLSMISEHMTMLDKTQVKPRQKQKKISYSINKNTDIIRYITFAIQNNLLYRTMISSAVVDKYDLYRMLAYYFSVLVFGYVSGFAVIHTLFLPIVIQNIVDIIWLP